MNKKAWQTVDECVKTAPRGQIQTYPKVTIKDIQRACKHLRTSLRLKHWTANENLDS